MSQILIGKGEQPVYLLAKYGSPVNRESAYEILRGVLGGILGGSRRR